MDEGGTNNALRSAGQRAEGGSLLRVPVADIRGGVDTGGVIDRTRSVVIGAPGVTVLPFPC